MLPSTAHQGSESGSYSDIPLNDLPSSNPLISGSEPAKTKRRTMDELRRGGEGDEGQGRRRERSESVETFRSFESLHALTHVSSWRFFDHVQSSSHAKLGMIDGVFLRSLSNIMGIIMFLRVGFMIAYAGILNSIFIILLASGLTMATALSLSAICTNGQVSGGGAYYMISRALGPEFGGSIGVLFYVANAVSVALYCLGFAETVKNQFLVGENAVFVSEGYDERIIAALALIAAFIICMVGVSWVVRMEKFLLGFLLSAVVLILFGAIAGPVPPPEKFSVLDVALESYSNRNHFIPGFQRGQLWLNMFGSFEGPPPVLLQDIIEITNMSLDSDDPPPVCDKQPMESLKLQYGIVNFAVVLAVFFPAVSGIMAGANVSGDLKDPSRAIPLGTIAAIIVSACVYILLITAIGANGVRSILINVADTKAMESASQATTGSSTNIWQCTYGGLYHEPLLPAKMAFFPTIVYLGIYSATLSSALTSLVSAPRILQAVAKDGLYPVLKPLARTVGRTKEPIRAYVVTFVISLICIMTGDINTVAPLISTFFLASYALVNYACYAADNSASPGWRPSFQYYSQQVSLLGALGCVSTMLLLSAVTGFITFVIGLALYKYIEVSGKESKNIADWGPAKNARQLNIALDAALRLEAISIKNTLPAGNLKGEVVDVDNTGFLEAIRLDSFQRFVSDGPEQALETSTRVTNHALDATHVKNFRPQCLVLCGPPGSRPGLCFLVNELRKAKGVNVFADIMIGNVSNVAALEERNKRALLSYVAEYGLKGFSEVVLANSFREGARSLIQLCGLGRLLRVNTVVMGFMNNWRETSVKKGDCKFAPLITLEAYVGVIGDAFDLGCGVAILRGEVDLFQEDSFRAAAKNARDGLLLKKNAVGHSSTKERNPGFEQGDHDEGSALSALQDKWKELKTFGKIAVKPVKRFIQGEFVVENTGAPTLETEFDTANTMLGASLDAAYLKRIDVYWFADDGGLTLMLPHLLRKATTPPFSGCSLRVIAVGETRTDAEKEQRAMQYLMKKLRVTASVQVVSLEMHIHGAKRSAVADQREPHTDELLLRLHRIGDLIAATSPGALLVVCSLPVPHTEMAPSRYMQWLEALSKNAGSPVLMVRGSHRDVLTILS